MQKPPLPQQDDLPGGGKGAPVEAVNAEIDPAQAEHMKRQAEQKRLEDLAKLDALGQSLAKTRAEAINARATSGIEDEWLEDEEFYQGIDEANRGEHKTNWRKKPPGQATRTEPGAQKTRSTVFPNITGPYVDSAAARIADMLLPTDDRSWSLKPTPVPETVDAAEGKFSQGMLKEAAALNPGQPDLAKKQLAIATQAAMQVIAEAKDKADKAQTRIEDWHVECQWHAQVRLVIEDAARIGTGILKGPIPMKKTRVAWKNGQRISSSEIKPGSKWTDPWNFFPDPACGESIHNGSYTWERDFITKKQLRDLKGQEDYVGENIDACLSEGATRAIGEYKPTPDMLVTDPSQKDKYEIWYFHGTAERDDLEAAGCDCADIEDPHLPALVVMVNNRVIKARLNPLDTGDFPYDVMVWRRRTGSWTGVGVARQIRTPQRIVTAGTRNLMDNAGLAAGPILVFRQGVVYPADGGPARIAPRMIYYIAEDAEGMDDATKAIGQIKVEMLVTELMHVIQLGLNLAEQVTGLPMLLQGQMGKAPDTLGGMQMLNNNASSTLRRLAKLFDDRITEPHVRRYYDWLLDYGKDDEKGDFSIDARGSSALVERDLQNQAVLQMGKLVLDPRFGADPKRWFAEYCKSQRLDVRRFEYEDEDWKKIVENMRKGPQNDPRVLVAQIRYQFEEKIKQVEQAFESDQNDKDRALEAWVTEMEQQGTKTVSLTDLKGKLADTTMKLGAQERMQVRGHAAKQVLTPPTEPAGTAPAGHAFER